MKTPVRLGSVELLQGGTYRYYGNTGRLMGSGRYAFSPGKGIVWQSGPFEQFAWGGSFAVEQGGRTHTIRLQSNTVATNTIRSNQPAP